ncbi:MAG: 4-hydroxy-3-methylbut-2-enyl diphosphate reductase [Clostridia bacterium]|nr:4-hydroxy-3-methylbut-2-enyl diphosphate reductase [Clostridia bacterium]
MNIVVGKNSGFCAGVKYTITKTEEALKNSSNGLDCLGEIIHNKQVIKDLESKGLRIIDSIDKATNKVIIRAHGISKDIYNLADKKNIHLIDLTCPNVLKIHKQVEDFSNKNYFIFLFGVKKHPETIGTISFCGINSCIIECKNDLENALDHLYKSGLKNVLIISQTTFSISLFDEMSKLITSTLDSSYNIKIANTICNATNLRQHEAEEIAKIVDLMIIIGGKNSSNTKKLYEVSSKHCKNVLSIETKEDLNIDLIKNFENIGIMAGASTPRIYY